MYVMMPCQVAELRVTALALTDATALVFNCQMGRGRTTTGMVCGSILLLAVRGGVIDRFLIAMRDSPAAAGTLGLDIRWFRVGLFAASAGMAGMAGALYSGLRQSVGAAEFGFFNSFTLLLLVVVAGVTSITGAALGGLGLMLFNNNPDLQAVLFIIIALAALLLARNPNGLAIYIFRGGNLLQRQLLPKIMASLPVLPGQQSAAGDGETEDGLVDESEATASRNDASVVTEGETVVTTTVPGEAKEVPAHVER